MKTTVEAVFEDGVFKPVTRLEIPEGQRVQITIQGLSRLSEDDLLEVATCVYRGLSAHDVDDIEEMARRRFFFTRDPA